MKKKTRTILVTLLTAMLLLAACSSAENTASSPAYAEKNAAQDYESYEAAEYMMDEAADYDYDSAGFPLAGAGAAGAEEGGWTEASLSGDEKDAGSGTTDDGPGEAQGSEPVTDRKLITTVTVEAETEALDDILAKVENNVKTMGGYIESSHISQDRTYTGNSNYMTHRRASLTLRIPETHLDTLLSTVSGETNILEEIRTTEDVTLTYVDTESRKKSLEAQRDSLMRLMEQAETVEDIITIEDRLSYVNYEIENLGSTLRTYDNLIFYSTVRLTLREVVEYTPVTEEPETVFSRISKGFSRNLKRVAGGLVDFFVFVVSSLPQIAVLAVVIAVLAKVLKWLKGRRDAEKTLHPEKRQREKKGLRGLFGRKKAKNAGEGSTEHAGINVTPDSLPGKEDREG